MSAPETIGYPSHASENPRRSRLLWSHLENVRSFRMNQTQAGDQQCPTVLFPGMPTRNDLDPSTLPFVPRTLDLWSVIASIQDRRNRAWKQGPQNFRRCEPGMWLATCP